MGSKEDPCSDLSYFIRHCDFGFPIEVQAVDHDGALYGERFLQLIYQKEDQDWNLYGQISKQSVSLNVEWMDQLIPKSILQKNLAQLNQIEEAIVKIKHECMVKAGLTSLNRMEFWISSDWNVKLKNVIV
jgi:hypothetical protein